MINTSVLQSPLYQDLCVILNYAKINVGLSLYTPSYKP